MYKKKASSIIKHFDFMLLDILCLETAFFIAYYFRHGGLVTENSFYLEIALVLLLINIFSTVFLNTFKNVLKRGYLIEFDSTAKHVALTLLISTFYLFVSQYAQPMSRLVFGVWAVLYFLLSYFTRLLYKGFVNHFLKMSANRSMMIITTSENANNIIDVFRNYHYEQINIIGLAIVDKDLIGETVKEVPVLSGKDDLVDSIARKWVDEVFVDLALNDKETINIIKQLNEMAIVVHLNLQNVIPDSNQKQFVEKVCGQMVLTNSVNYVSTMGMLLKRTMDICAGLAGCLITLILCIIIGPMIYFKSPGPIFFSQIRIGRNGRRFKMYKFRSMYLGAEERKKTLMDQNKVSDGMMFKMDFDPRIIGNDILPDGTKKTGVGQFIRRYSLDEFPQFFNVLIGDMSLVGTRPPTEDEWIKYKLHHRARMAIKPGITGLWQVSGRSNITDFEKVVALDMEYIRNWSIGLDIKILFKTFKVVFEKEGSM